MFAALLKLHDLGHPIRGRLPVPSTPHGLRHWSFSHAAATQHTRHRRRTGCRPEHVGKSLPRAQTHSKDMPTNQDHVLFGITTRVDLQTTSALAYDPAFAERARETFQHKRHWHALGTRR